MIIFLLLFDVYFLFRAIKSKFTMNENYLRIVRKSLYKPKLVEKQTESKPTKIIFQAGNYRSENVFEDTPPSSSDKSEKIRGRKSTPYPKGKKGVQRISSPKRKTTPVAGKHLPKKRKLRAYLASDEFQSPRPALSENSFFSFQGSFHNDEDDKESTDGDGDGFDAEEFFETRSHGRNELMDTEPHSGIECEFQSEYATEANITGYNFIDEREDISEDSEEVSQDQPTVATSTDTFEFPSEVNSNTSIRELTSSSDAVEWNASATNDTKFESGYNDSTHINGTSPLQLSEYENPRKQSKSNFDILDYIHGDVQIEAPQDQNVSIIMKGGIKEFNLDDYKLVILKEGSSTHFNGLFVLDVLYGEVEIFGSIIKSTSRPVAVYSPRGTALLCIKNISKSNETVMLKNLLPFSNSLDTIKDHTVEENTAVIKCTELLDKNIKLVEKYMSHQLFPPLSRLYKPRVVFNPKDILNVFRSSAYWNEILLSVKQSTKLLIAGGKSLGKSTFLRYAINKLLDNYEELRVIDLDPGQSEFYVPGSVYVVTVKEKVFGPNYTHIKKPERAILTNINTGHNPAAYIRSVELLMEYVNSLDQNIPTLINYMGFAKGIGLKIISSTIAHVCPTDVVQIVSTHRHKNFPEDLTVETIRKNCDCFSGNANDLKFTLHQVMAVAEEYAGWSAEQRQVREMCVLAYLGEMMGDDVNSLTSHEVPMYQVKLSSLDIRSLEGNELLPSAVNANLVALCEVDEDTSLFVCHGYGIVRGVDLDNDQLVLITPEPLNSIKTLVLTGVSLPPSVYMTFDDVKGTVPYVMEGQLVSLGQLTKRSYLPANKR